MSVLIPGPTPGPEDSGGDGAGSRRRGRGRGKKILAAAIAVAAAGAVTVAAAGLISGGEDAEASGAGLPATAEVTRETLHDTIEVDGELNHGATAATATRLAGTLTWLPQTDAEVSRGETLYSIDELPVVLMYGSTPAHRELSYGVENGADVERLEQNLSELGYTGFTVDEEFTEATADAVEEWQEDVGLPETGVVELGRVVFAGGALRVESLETEVGQALAPGQNVLTYSGTAKMVTVETEPGNQRLAEEDTAVSVTLPDGSSVAGEVVETGTITETSEGGTGDSEETETVLEVLISLEDQEAVADLDEAVLDVTFMAGERADVLTVPVAALVALREGGFGVEVVEGTTTRYVAVDVGLFAGGRVEVSGEGLAEGMAVGVPG
ncbi:efflux RND transporter periplasmic adaptor subunit [Streptomyces sp. 8K308]|uniref:peptidoglycan-binding protein n=1 Tax=Streptomyces sp. 8K308 TaxID=2530388 RepID=UPI00104350BC|nr:peptidoglycan-binding protein [Streptomyces sp. 8K308]TDC12509.1 efflux RND transporter periplasmic adaptor subunit [Streptomyces sp. 8K308]